MIQRVCEVCEKEFSIYPFTALDKTRGRFCSRTCFNKSLIGEKARNWMGNKIGYGGI
ncbi:hypothetical protein LCGC14_1973180, partial [marine sediment metagenome]